jgi:DUF438 domain-containing protein
MLNFHIQHPESWEEVAERIQKEKDPEKVLQLTNELIAAIDLQVGNPVKKRSHSVKLDQRSGHSH